MQWASRLGLWDVTCCICYPFKNHCLAEAEYLSWLCVLSLLTSATGEAERLAMGVREKFLRRLHLNRGCPTSFRRFDLFCHTYDCLNLCPTCAVCYLKWYSTRISILLLARDKWSPWPLACYYECFYWRTKQIGFKLVSKTHDFEIPVFLWSCWFPLNPWKY